MTFVQFSSIHSLSHITGEDSFRFQHTCHRWLSASLVVCPLAFGQRIAGSNSNLDHPPSFELQEHCDHNCKLDGIDKVFKSLPNKNGKCQL